MACTLSNPALSNVLLEPICGLAVLRSKDCHDVEVPLVPLLGVSSLVRSVVTESHLHPAIHGGLILNLAVAAEVLVSVGELLATGVTNVKGENIEGIKQVFCMIGAEVNLSCNRIINLEMKFEPNSYKEIDLNYSDINEEEEDFVASWEDKKIMMDQKIYKDSEEIAVKGEENNSVGESVSYAKKCKNKISHTNSTIEKKHKCNECQYSSSKLSHLKAHIRIHTSEKPYPCDICHLSFKEKSNLTKHYIIHSGEKPYECNICFSTFRYKKSLKYHTTHKCKLWNYPAVSSSEVRKHKKRKQIG